MKSVIKNLPKAIKNPNDYTARSNIMWASSMAENRIIKNGKTTDFEAHQIEHQLGAFTNCNHRCGLVVISPTYYRHIYKEGISKFVQFAVNVWNISSEGKKSEEVALEGIKALEDFIDVIGLPRTLRKMGITDKSKFSEIAKSCNISQGSFKIMTAKEIEEILNECY